MSNVQVAVRARPLSQRELDCKAKVSIEMKNKSTIIFRTVDGIAVGESKNEAQEFEYDYSYWSVYPSDKHFVTQEKVFDNLGKSVLESAFQGYNACVFAYGQTGSGKTYTMMGSEESPGLIPRICESLFGHIVNGNKRDVSYRVEASYMEIYNEKVRDLLTGPPSSLVDLVHTLKIREHPKEGPYVENLSRQNVTDFQAISELMKTGNKYRVTASTKMNDVSSRSHAIFTIIFTQAAYSSDLPCETVSKIHLVDLAGSERVSATGVEGLRLKEGGNINRSLACLGNVISALADRAKNKAGGKKSFIPYRDSVLTWLLKDSLGGNSKTIMVATISPAEVNYGETLSTLRYASRAKKIVNRPTVNEDANVKLIRELRNEIKRLKAIIVAAKLDDSELMVESKSVLAENIHKKEEMVAELTKHWADKWDEGIQNKVERNLALHSEGIKMTLGSERPHLLTVDNDVYGAGVIIYHLKNGQTTIGIKDSSLSPDIALSSIDILPLHCILDNVDNEVTLVLSSGKCFVNHEEVVKDRKLSHGDLLQLGEVTVFRFNHPQEAQKLRETSSTPRTDLLPISPISPSYSTDSRLLEDFEEKREALERDYNDKLKKMKEEFERRNEEDKAKLLEELDVLRQQNMYTSTSDNLDDDPRKNSTYELLQSIPYTKIEIRETTPDISDRVVTGKEREAVNISRYSQSPILSLSSLSSLTPDSTPPENRFSRTAIMQHQIDEDTVDINLVRRSDYASRNVDEHRNFQGVGTEGTDGDTDDEGTDIGKYATYDSQLMDELKKKDRQCKETEEKMLEVESMLTEARVKALNLQQDVDSQNVQHQKEQEELLDKVKTLQKELLDKNSGNIRRSRSNAFGEKDSPKLRHGKRRHSSLSRSCTSSKSRFKVEVPGCLLRGEGWGSYYVYEVRIQLSGEKWSVYKSYAQFKIFYQEILKRYSQLSVLTFPPTKWFGAKTRTFVERRRLDLQTFLQSLIAICSNLPECPLYTGRHMTKDKLCSFSTFFDSGNTTGL